MPGQRNWRDKEQIEKGTVLPEIIPVFDEEMCVVKYSYCGLHIMIDAG